MSIKQWKEWQQWNPWNRSRSLPLEMEMPSFGNAAGRVFPQVLNQRTQSMVNPQSTLNQHLEGTRTVDWWRVRLPLWRTPLWPTWTSSLISCSFLSFWRDKHGFIWAVPHLGFLIWAAPLDWSLDWDDQKEESVMRQWNWMGEEWGKFDVVSEHAIDWDTTKTVFPIGIPQIVETPAQGCRCLCPLLSVRNTIKLAFKCATRTRSRHKNTSSPSGFISTCFLMGCCWFVCSYCSWSILCMNSLLCVINAINSDSLSSHTTVLRIERRVIMRCMFIDCCCIEWGPSHGKTTWFQRSSTHFFFFFNE